MGKLRKRLDNLLTAYAAGYMVSRGLFPTTEDARAFIDRLETMRNPLRLVSELRSALRVP